MVTRGGADGQASRTGRNSAADHGRRGHRGRGNRDVHTILGANGPGGEPEFGIPAAAERRRRRAGISVLDAQQASEAVLYARDLLAESAGYAGLLPRLTAAAGRAHLLFRSREFQRNALARLGRRRLDRVPLRPDRRRVRRPRRRLHVAEAYRRARRKRHKAADRDPGPDQRDRAGLRARPDHRPGDPRRPHAGGHAADQSAGQPHGPEHVRGRATGLAPRQGPLVRLRGWLSLDHQAAQTRTTSSRCRTRSPAPTWWTVRCRSHGPVPAGARVDPHGHGLFPAETSSTPALPRASTPTSPRRHIRTSCSART